MEAEENSACLAVIFPGPVFSAGHQVNVPCHHFRVAYGAGGFGNAGIES